MNEECEFRRDCVCFYYGEAEPRGCCQICEDGLCDKWECPLEKKGAEAGDKPWLSGVGNMGNQISRGE